MPPLARAKADSALSLVVKKYLTVPDDPLLIKPPRRALLVFVVIQWLFMFIAWMLTYNVLIIAAVPLWVYILYIFGLFSKNVWHAYGYSRIVLTVLTVAVNFGLFVLAELFRGKIAVFIIKGIFG